MKRTAAALILAALLVAGCTSAPSHHAQRGSTAADLAGSAGAVQDMQSGQVLRLGYLEDFGSAPALAALQARYYRQDMGGVSVQAQGFASDLDEIFALEHGQLDAAYLDPVAAISAWQFMATGSLHVIGGAVTGPSELIVRPGITSPAQLSGTRVEAPADSSQAAALDAWLTATTTSPGTSALDGSPVTTAGILAPVHQRHCRGRLGTRAPRPGTHRRRRPRPRRHPRHRHRRGPRRHQPLPGRRPGSHPEPA